MRKIILRVDGKHSTIRNENIKLDQGKQQAIFILLFTVLYLFRDLAGVNIPDVAFSGLCAVAFVLSDKGTCLGFYIFTTALTAPHNEITIVYIVISIFKKLSSGKVQVNGRMALMTLGLLLLQLVNMTIFSTDNVSDIIYDYVTRMLIISVPLFWFDDTYSAEDFRSALLCYAAGAILGGTVTMLLAADRVTWEVLLKGTGGYRLGRTYNADEGMQTTYNSNQLGVMFSIAVAIVLQCIDQKKMSKILGVVLIGYALFIIALTRSRAGILTMAMAVIIYYLVLVVRRKRLFSGLLLLGGIGILVLIVLHLFPGVAQAALDRFVDQVDITNGRTELLVDYLRLWNKDPWCFFFGYGIGSYENIVSAENTPHNAVADILISWGIVGMLLVARIVYMFWRKGVHKVNKKDRIVSLLPAVTALVASMAEQYLTTDYPHPRLCFLFLAAKAFETDEKQPINSSGSR